ncbi:MULTISPECIES: sensor histidine kinase [Rhizobium]|uniref:histidine kinase n=2 Tax=Rhizobium TaxID=379 RepID=A0A4R3RYQ0_9HYPH|nr:MULTISPECIES: sensor histidine kinase [Rhizobium]TCU40841.1 two-component sensor histidine kinase [Rhizobium azibense]
MRLKLVAVAVAALAPVVAMLVYNELETRLQRNEEIRGNAAQAARLAASEVERIIEGLHGLLVAVASMPAIQDLDAAACDRALRSVASSVSNIRTIFVTDLSGHPVCGSVEPPSGVRFADRDYFRQALASGRFVVGTYTDSRMSKGAVLPVAMPLMKGGIAQRVLVTGLRLEWLQDRIAERGVEGGNAITIADSNGTILAHVPNPGRFVGTAIPAAFRHLIYAGFPGIIEVKGQDGIVRILGYRPIELPNNPLYIDASISKEEAFAPINRATEVNALSIIGGALLAFLAAVLIGNRFIVRPIHHIARVMGDWRAGRTDVRTRMDPAKDDLGAVGATLDSLLDELDTRHRQAKEAEDERDLLSREMAHRVKNGYALVQAIARQSFAKSDPSRYAVFSERLTALAGAYDLILTREAHSADMSETIRKSLRPHHEVVASRVEVTGPQVSLPAELTLALSLVVHELGTNAMKYGALSTDEGRIAVDWTLKDRRVQLTWQETGGPKVTQPIARGFGSVLIEKAFPAKYQAKSLSTYGTSGLIFELAFSLPAEPADDLPVTTFQVPRAEGKDGAFENPRRAGHN